jgi:outer membrane protein TolC
MGGQFVNYFNRLGRQWQVYVEALRTYASTARLRYENGYTSYIEMLDAERSLFDAELA